MKGKKQIVSLPNAVLPAELPAVNQYFPPARLCHHWGYGRLYERVRKESIEEMKHADELIERILYLEGMPNLQRYGKVNVGDRKSTRLNSSHLVISYAVFCLKKKKEKRPHKSYQIRRKP